MEFLKRQQAKQIEKERKKIERWSVTRAKGKWRYILLTVLLTGLGIGTIMAVVTALMENGLSPQKFIAGWPMRFWLVYVVMGSLVGLFFGWREWNFYESVYLKSMQSNNQP